MSIVFNRAEFIIRRCVLQEEKKLPKKGFFTLGRSGETLASGSFESLNKKSLSEKVREARSSVYFPTPEEAEARRLELEAAWAKKRMAKIKKVATATAPRLFGLTSVKKTKNKVAKPVLISNSPMPPEEVLELAKKLFPEK